MPKNFYETRFPSMISQLPNRHDSVQRYARMSWAQVMKATLSFQIWSVKQCITLTCFRDQERYEDGIEVTPLLAIDGTLKDDKFVQTS